MFLGESLYRDLILLDKGICLLNPFLVGQGINFNNDVPVVPNRFSLGIDGDVPPRNGIADFQGIGFGDSSCDFGGDDNLAIRTRGPKSRDELLEV